MNAARISLTGRVFEDDFPPWIRRHSRKLGLELLNLSEEQGALVIEAFGAEPMLQALALGCALGPESVLVDEFDIEIKSLQ
ncbi:MAG: acylphosphatase [Pseudomonadota bacterium]